MQPNERYDIILQMLSTQEMVTIPELMETFEVSVETVRRDLNHMESKHLIKKVYGGAILFNRPVNDASLDDRHNKNISEKSAIGRRCASLINDGDSLYLGPGTTVRQVARHLREHKNLIVLTDSLYVVMELMNTDVELYFMGGCIDLHDGHVSDMMPQNTWDFFHPNKAIIGVRGISAEHGLTDMYPKQAYMIKNVIARSMNVFVVADNSKFGLVGSCETCPLERADRIITGSAKKEEILKDFSFCRQRFLFAEDYIPEVPAR